MSLRINKAFMIPTRKSGFNDMYVRSYNLNATHETMNNLENILSRTGGGLNGKLHDVSVVNNIPEIMSLSATPIGTATIANGWQTQRLTFILEVESNVNGLSMVSYIQGYSEYHDPSLSGHIDPNMIFNINSIATVTRMVDPVTGAIIATPHSNFNIVKDSFNNAHYQEVQDDNLKLIRPTDVIANIGHIHTFGDDPNVNIFSDNLSGGVFTSARGNNSAVKHFTKTVNSYINTRNTNSVGYMDNENLLIAASEVASETNLLAIPFIAHLRSITGLTPPVSFTLNQLSKLDPDIANKILLIDNNAGMVNTTPTILDSDITEVNYKPNYESTIAMTIAHSVNDMLVSNLLTEISFSSTNITGPTITSIIDVRSLIEGINTTVYANKVMSTIDTILMPEITRNNSLIVDILVTSSLLVDTTVSVSLNGNPPVVFRYPTFSDSLYVPVISDEINSSRMSDDMGLVLDTVTNVTAGNETIMI